MSFCAVEKLQVIKDELKKVPAYRRMTLRTKGKIQMAILDGLYEIDKLAFQYKHL